MEVASLLNVRVKRTVILNDINQDNNKVLEDKSKKNSSSVVFILVWSKPCLHFRVWLRWSNKVLDLRKSAPWNKIKTLPAVQTRNRVWISHQET